MCLVFLTFLDVSYLWKTYQRKQIFLLMKYSLFHFPGRETDTHMRMSYVSQGSFAASMLISTHRNLHCLASLLVPQKFLGEKKKKKSPLVTLQTVSQSCAKYWYWKAGSYSHRLLCWGTAKDLARMVWSCQTPVPIPGTGLCSQPCFLWGGLVLSPSARYTARGSLWQEWITVPAFPGSHSCYFPVDGVLYLQAAPSGSLCPCTTGGLAWETPSSRHSSHGAVGQHKALVRLHICNIYTHTHPHIYMYIC